LIFVDTSAWFACVVPSDSNYAAATRWLNENSEPLLTTDYVVDETLTLLQRRGEVARAQRLGEHFFTGTLATISYLNEADIFQAWQTFRQFTDKEWSFTDCSSKVVIERFQITRAFAFDRHFRQFGSVVVVP
jgi:predicted nucleic acid-binding protein